MQAFNLLRNASLPGVALLVCMPLLIVVGAFFVGLFGAEQRETLAHLWQFVIGEYIHHTVILMVGVALLVSVIGVATAWLTTACTFAGVSWLRWALLLPLAMPAYITAYTYSGMLSFEGPVQSFLRAVTGWQFGDYYFPEIRSITGATLVMGFVLFPYVYLITRAAFIEQSRAAIEAARTLGLTPWQSFWRVALPMARPAIATGVTLALMETLADYGTVHFYGVTTFTTGIFRTWYGMGDPLGALQLASILLSAVVVLIVVERISRQKSKYHHAGRSQQKARPFKLTRGKAFAAFAVCFTPVLLGFILPALQLLLWSADQLHVWLEPAFIKLITNSVMLAVVASLVTVLVALWLCYGKRRTPTLLTRVSINFASLGYAIPGVVVAVGVIIPFAWLDHRIIDISRSLFGYNPGLVLSGTIVAILFAYLVRFLSVSIQTIDSGLAQIKTSMDESGRILGLNPRQILTRIHFPLLRTSILTATLLVFVDVLKELPATLILRPFNFNTLAVRAYELAGDERLAEAGPAALMIVLAGLIPVILLSRAMQERHNDKGAVVAPKVEEIYEPVKA
ncbi:ABC transporter permease [Aliidiomarina celeris]|uniref:ABC transporter permease n=1 Tax=Aliidiomarina celeris TaxID=2249428 RepID=UPI000DE9381B|nr:iron ABC transporter permease [Aliidiomarina celeris]